MFSVWAPLSSNSSKSAWSGLPTTVSGSIILSAVRLVVATGSWRARKKSSGPRGRPGSEEKNWGAYKGNMWPGFTALTYCEVHSYLGHCVPLEWVREEVRREQKRSKGERAVSSSSRTRLTAPPLTVRCFSCRFVSKGIWDFLWPFCLRPWKEGGCSKIWPVWSFKDYVKYISCLHREYARNHLKV